MMILDILKPEIFSPLFRPNYDLNVLNYDFRKLGSQAARSDLAGEERRWRWPT